MRLSLHVRLLVAVACITSVAFEYHPDHTTCEDAEIAIDGMEAIDNWPLDKPLRCIWSTGVISSPHVNGKEDHEFASCHIADFLAKLHHPQEIRAIKLYMQDLHAPCFDKYLNDHKMFFPKLQILHLASSMQTRRLHGEIWLTAFRMTNVVQLRELVITTYDLHEDVLAKWPVMHHLDVFGLEADIVHPDGPSLLQLMLRKAPNVINIHLGGALIPSRNTPNTMSMDTKSLWQRCPEDVCSGLTSLSLNSNKLYVIGIHELGHVLKALPSLRKFSMGRLMQLAANGMDALARILEHMGHPLNHLHFHIDSMCSYKYKGSVLYTQCLDGLANMLTALPDLTDISTNYNDHELQLGEDFEDLVDDSIRVHNISSWEQLYEWGAHPPDLHPPIEEHLSDVQTEIRAPEALPMNLTELHVHKNLTRGRSMNLPPRPPKQEWQIKFEERAASHLDKPWLHDMMHSQKVQEFHADPIDRKERMLESLRNGESPMYYRPQLFQKGEL